MRETYDDTQQQEGARNALVWPDILTKTHDIGGPKEFEKAPWSDRSTR